MIGHTSAEVGGHICTHAAFPELADGYMVWTVGDGELRDGQRGGERMD